jgi:hypothetical protein
MSAPSPPMAFISEHEFPRKSHSSPRWLGYLAWRLCPRRQGGKAGRKNSKNGCLGPLTLFSFSANTSTVSLRTGV